MCVIDFPECGLIQVLSDEVVIFGMQWKKLEVSPTMLSLVLDDLIFSEGKSMPRCHYHNCCCILCDLKYMQNILKQCERDVEKIHGNFTYLSPAMESMERMV
jgi:hypothetical protein